MKLSPHLVFNGQCHEAFSFYERALGGKIVTMLSYGESPMADQVAPEWHGRIVHATLTLGDDVLSGIDALPTDFKPPQGFYILLDPGDPDEGERVFRLLAQHGDVRISVQKTFWSPCYGMLVDRFGIPWEISCAGEGSPG